MRYRVNAVTGKREQLPPEKPGNRPGGRPDRPPEPVRIGQWQFVTAMRRLGGIDANRVVSAIESGPDDVQDAWKYLAGVPREGSITAFLVREKELTENQINMIFSRGNQLAE